MGTYRSRTPRNNLRTHLVDALFGLIAGSIVAVALYLITMAIVLS